MHASVFKSAERVSMRSDGRRTSWGRARPAFGTAVQSGCTSFSQERFRGFKVLKERRIAVLAADGFEKVELTVPVKSLRLAGAKVDIISLRHGRIRGVNLHEPASRVKVTK